MNKKSDHPDLAEIDAVRTGEASAETVVHVESCERCGRLLAELRSLANDAGPHAAEGTRIPHRVDDAVLTIIEKRVTEIQWRRPSRINFISKPIWAAAAAIVIIFLSLFMFTERSPQMDAVRVAKVRGDMDGSGMVDVVDAYLMALQMDANTGKSDGMDFNSDGLVDDSDVRDVMRQVVAVVEEV